MPLCELVLSWNQVIVTSESVHHEELINVVSEIVSSMEYNGQKDTKKHGPFSSTTWQSNWKGNWKKYEGVHRVMPVALCNGIEKAGWTLSTAMGSGSGSLPAFNPAHGGACSLTQRFWFKK
jgi:hypothetical protein